MKTRLGVLVDVVTVAAAIAALALVGERYLTVLAPAAAPSAMGTSLLNTRIDETFGVDFAGRNGRSS